MGTSSHGLDFIKLLRSLNFTDISKNKNIISEYPGFTLTCAVLFVENSTYILTPYCCTLFEYVSYLQLVVAYLGRIIKTKL